MTHQDVRPLRDESERLIGYFAKVEEGATAGDFGASVSKGHWVTLRHRNPKNVWPQKTEREMAGLVAGVAGVETLRYNVGQRRFERVEEGVNGAFEAFVVRLDTLEHAAWEHDDSA